MTAIQTVAATGDQDIDGILSGVRWATHSLSYGFTTDPAQYVADYAYGLQATFRATTLGQRKVIADVLDLYATVADISFVKAKDPATADLRFAQTGAREIPTAAAFYPSVNEEGGDVWFNKSRTAYRNPEPGTYGYLTIVHEIGHALGLKHGHETDGFGAMTREHDSMEYSVMTYRSGVGSKVGPYPNEYAGFASTPMMYDIAALQTMYGANFTSHAGNDVYRWSPTTGEMTINDVGQGVPGGNRIFMTLWDGGGIDTYDFSNYSSRLTVSLEPGAWSTVATAQVASLGSGRRAEGNIANALLFQGDARSLIENAVGGSGIDKITGNAAGNRLHGGAGNDALFGLGGDDVLIGGDGLDRLTGGAGSDLFLFTGGDVLSAPDRILDFEIGIDKIAIDASLWSLSAPFDNAALPADAFLASRVALTPEQRFLYAEGTGALYFDADGNGTAAAVHIANILNHASLTASDFLLLA